MKERPECDELRGEMRHVEGVTGDLQSSRTEREDSEAYFKGILEAFDGFVYVCSPDNRIEFVNNKVIKHIGRDVTGELCYEAVYDLDSLCPWCVEQPVFDGVTRRYESRNPKNGRWYHNIVTPIWHKNGSISKLTICLDITAGSVQLLGLEPHQLLGTGENPTAFQNLVNPAFFRLSPVGPSRDSWPPLYGNWIF